MDEIETLNQFLEAWKLQAWSKMADRCQATWRSKHADPAAALCQLYELRQLESFEIKDVIRLSDSAYRVPVRIKYRVSAAKGFGQSRLKTAQLLAMVICESAPYRPTSEGAWGVNPISTMRLGTAQDRKAKKQVIKQL